MVHVDKETILQSSVKLGINYSTAKSIVRKFRSSGDINPLDNNFLARLEELYSDKRPVYNDLLESSENKREKFSLK